LKHGVNKTGLSKNTFTEQLDFKLALASTHKLTSPWTLSC